MVSPYQKKARPAPHPTKIDWQVKNKGVIIFNMSPEIPQDASETNIPKDGVEKEANFEGNATLLYYSRLKNLKIKRQLIDSICDYYTENKGAEIEHKSPEPRSRERIERELDDQIKKVFSVTALDYSTNATSNAGGIEINGEHIYSGVVAPF